MHLAFCLASVACMDSGEQKCVRGMRIRLFFVPRLILFWQEKYECYFVIFFFLFFSSFFSYFLFFLKSLPYQYQTCH